MARTQQRVTNPPEDTEKGLPVYHYNEQGKIDNWCRDWKIAKLLDTLVLGGQLDKMTPSNIRAKFPQFAPFDSTSFAGAVRNSRARVNKDVVARTERKATGGKSKSFVYLWTTLSQH